MDDRVISKIDKLIEESRPELVKDLARLIPIKSVESEPKPGAPFGEGPRAVLDEVLKIGKERGFEPADYGVGVVSLALKKGQPDLGIWTHGDVVPEGDGWIYEPYNATLFEDCVIGRGATDNKGQLVSILHLFSIFRALGIELKYNAALYVGSNEETGMRDLIGIEGNEDAKGFLNVCTPPRLSLVPDSGFPVGFAGKGKLVIGILPKTPLQNVLLEAGRPETPGKAEAVIGITDCPDLPGCTVEKQDGKVRITVETAPRHSAHPDAEGNMVSILTKAILEARILSAEDAGILDFICRVAADCNGALFGVDRPSETMGLTSFVPLEVRPGSEGRPELMLNIRYTNAFTAEEIIERIGAVSEREGFELGEIKKGVRPYVLDPNSEMIQMLNAVANEVTGQDRPPFCLSGGTYAHRLPNAYAFGMSGNKAPEGFPKGHGGAHGRDELVSLERLERAMKIYARALLRLNEMEW